MARPQVNLPEAFCSLRVRDNGVPVAGPNFLVQCLVAVFDLPRDLTPFGLLKIRPQHPGAQVFGHSLPCQPRFGPFLQRAPRLSDHPDECSRIKAGRIPPMSRPFRQSLSDCAC